MIVFVYARSTKNNLKYNLVRTHSLFKTLKSIHNRELGYTEVTFYFSFFFFSRYASSPASSSSSRLHGVKLPRSALRFFLKHLHRQIQRNDPEGVFAEPVTDDIAPGYSSIIKRSMDLQTIGAKIDSNSYSTVDEFKVYISYIPKLPPHNYMYM